MSNKATFQVAVSATFFISVYPAATTTRARAAAEAAAERKSLKYATLKQHHLFVPIAIETFDSICEEGQGNRSIGKRISTATNDPRKAAFLFQRLSVTVQRYNANCFAGTFTQPPKPVTPRYFVFQFLSLWE